MCCCQGCGTDESTLTRIMVSRSELDLKDIRGEFKKQYESSLHSAIKVRKRVTKTYPRLHTNRRLKDGFFRLTGEKKLCSGSLTNSKTDIER